MLKINVGLSRKVTEDYNSKGFSLNIEGELPSDLLHDPNQLETATNKLFQLANLMLDEQVQRATCPDRRITPTNGNGHSSDRNGNRNGNPPVPSRSNGNGRGQSTERSLTQAQGRAITNMARKLELNLEDWLDQNYGVYSVDHLSVKSASQVIDRLKKELDAEGVQR